MVSQAASPPSTMECPVCYCNDATCSLVCGHSFCGQCVKEWWLKSESECQGCPMCRRAIYFRGMKSKVAEWDNERHEQMLERVYARVFDEIVDDVEDDFGAAMAMFSLREFGENFQKMRDLDGMTEENMFDMASNIFIEFVTENPPPEYDELRTFEHMLFVPKKKSAIQRSPKSPRARVPRVPTTDLWDVVILV